MVVKTWQAATLALRARGWSRLTNRIFGPILEYSTDWEMRFYPADVKSPTQ